MSDLNNDGKIDSFERKHYTLQMGRSFALTLFGMIAIIVLAILKVAETAFMPIVWIIGIYCGRAIGSDIAKGERLWK